MTATAWAVGVGKPITPSPPVPQLPAGVAALAGAKGLACAAVCEAAGRRCAPEHFGALNDCNRLREHFACEARTQAHGFMRSRPQAHKQTRGSAESSSAVYMPAVAGPYHISKHV